MDPMEQEFNEADMELQQLLWLSLDRCHQNGAREDDLRFLAWQCGVTDWTPTTKEQRA